MSTNSEEKELKEPLETAEETPSQEEKKETKKEEKKGFLKKDPKKEKIAQLEKEVEELNGKLRGTKPIGDNLTEKVVGLRGYYSQI